MNLQENYKRLFKGRIRSNDSKLINEDVNQKVQDAYDQVYDLTGRHGDEPLEVMDEFLEDAGIYDLHTKFLEEEPLSSMEAKKLIDVYNEVVAEVGALGL
jgi:hypothetical protein